jgi:hypothetical protein
LQRPTPLRIDEAEYALWERQGVSREQVNQAIDDLCMIHVLGGKMTSFATQIEDQGVTVLYHQTTDHNIMGATTALVRVIER